MAADSDDRDDDVDNNHGRGQLFDSGEKVGRTFSAATSIAISISVAIGIAIAIAVTISLSYAISYAISDADTNTCLQNQWTSDGCR